MQYLCTPWRMEYLRSEKVSGTCPFCLKNGGDELSVIAHSAHVFIILNRYPYNSGHLMIVPNQHLSSLEDLTEVMLGDFMLMTKRALQVLRQVYDPQGFNMGANIGSVAGAGVPGHFHWHIVPRWSGDSSFMTVAADTRVLPEALPDTARNLREAWKRNFGTSG